MKWPAYPAYKPSGVEWLVDVPEHWRLAPLGYLVRVRGGATPDKTRSEYWDGSIPWVSPKDMKRARLHDAEDHVSEEALRDSALSMIPEEAVLVVVRGMILAHSFPVALTEAPVTINQDMKALLCGRALHPRFLTWALAGTARAVVALADESAHGTRKLEAAILTKLPISVPSLNEQWDIADFLDAQTAKLDTLVAKKHALGERLREKRATLISHTVTRGLPPDAARGAGLDFYPKLRPSGIEWLSDIPQHWETSKIKYAARIESGHTPSRSVDDYWIDCTIPWVSLNDSGYLRDHDYITDTAYNINELGLANSSARLLPSGAVVFSRDATIGLCAITTRTVAVSQHFVAYICGPRLLAKYLLVALKAMGQHLERLSLGATIATIGMADVRALACPIPPLTEQHAIADFLDRETAKIEQLIAKVETAIERLQEYRAALITAAVTGKIDVRGGAA